MDDPAPPVTPSGSVTRVLFGIATGIGVLFLALVTAASLSEPGSGTGFVLGRCAGYCMLPAYALLSIVLTLLSLSAAKRIQANFWLHHTHTLIILGCILAGYLYGLSH